VESQNVVVVIDDIKQDRNLLNLEHSLCWMLVIQF